MGQFGILWVKLCHPLLKLGDLGKLAKVGLVLVEIRTQRLRLVYQLGFLGQSVDDRLEEYASVWSIHRQRKPVQWFVRSLIITYW